MTQKDLAAAAGVAERTIQSLEAGSRPQARNRSKIERALGWPNGEMRRIEFDDGSRPPPVPKELLAFPDLVEDIRRRYPRPEDYVPMLEAIAATLRGESPPTEPGTSGTARSPERRTG